MFKLKVVYALLRASRNPKFRECVREILVVLDYKVKSKNTDNVYNMRANTIAKVVDIENQDLVEDHIKDSKQKLSLRSAISHYLLLRLYEDLLGKPLEVPKYK